MAAVTSGPCADRTGADMAGLKSSSETTYTNPDQMGEAILRAELADSSDSSDDDVCVSVVSPEGRLDDSVGRSVVGPWVALKETGPFCLTVCLPVSLDYSLCSSLSCAIKGIGHVVGCTDG